MATYVTARTVNEALAALATGARPIAGGTDLVVGGRQGKKPLPDSLVGIHRLPGFGTIEETADDLEIGALVTHGALAASDLIRARYTGLADAAAVVGSHATRANGTIGGNVMNASPAMDTGAPLLCMGAQAELTSSGGTRVVDLSDLWSGPRTTSARPDELLLWIRLPVPPAGTGTSYVRLQYRRQMEIAVVGAGVSVTLEDGVVARAAIAITSLAPIIHRVPAAETALAGTDGGPDAVRVAANAAAAAARPIDDVRASADYRRAMAALMTARAIQAALARARGESVAIPASESTFGNAT